MTPEELEDLDVAVDLNNYLAAKLKELKRESPREKWIIRRVAKFWTLAGGSEEDGE